MKVSDIQLEPAAEELAPKLRNNKGQLQAIPLPGRNEPCTCGSGIKYKKCCLEIDKKIILRAEQIRKDKTRIIL